MKNYVIPSLILIMFVGFYLQSPIIVVLVLVTLIGLYGSISEHLENNVMIDYIKMPFEKTDESDVVKMREVGKIKSTYNEMLSAFGKPNVCNLDDLIIDIYWELKFEDNTIVSISNKEEFAYKLSDINTWIIRSVGKVGMLRVTAHLDKLKPLKTNNGF